MRDGIGPFGLEMAGLRLRLNFSEQVLQVVSCLLTTDAQLALDCLVT